MINANKDMDIVHDVDDNDEVEFEDLDGVRGRSLDLWRGRCVRNIVRKI